MNKKFIDTPLDKSERRWMWAALVAEILIAIVFLAGVIKFTIPHYFK